jgi:4-amino-4-deoxy-L-arabinose transferase-like glycosyltransferase
VYGTWPVIFVKGIAEFIGHGGYGDLTLVGRFLSAFVDTGTAILVFFLTKRLLNLSQSSNDHARTTGYIAMFLYSIMALPIQLAHFYTTDPYVTFAITATLLALTVSPSILMGSIVGILFGLSLAAKISAAPFILIIFIATGLHFLKNKNVTQILLYGLFMGVFSFCSLRVFMPYLFADSNFFTIHLNQKVIANWKELQSFEDPKAWFPPGVQWIHTTPLLFPLWNMIAVELGFPLALVSFIGIGSAVRQCRKHPFLLLPIGTMLLFFIYEGIQFAKPMRYFYVMYPPIAILSGLALSSKIKGIRHLPILIGVTILLILWPLSVVSIYRNPISRVTASEWIYSHIPPGSVLTMETWDDGLPLNFPGKLNNQYAAVQLPMYYPDSPEKWNEINDKLKTVQYLILSSNRVYGSISSDADRFPETTKFYDDLFSGKKGFTPIAQFTSRPTIPIPGVSLCVLLPFFEYGMIDRKAELVTSSLRDCSGIQFVDDYVDESWTVYDHPKVTIFQRER